MKKDIDKNRPKLIILAVYKNKTGNWRGFCSPFDVSTEANSKEKAMQQLEKLVGLYKEGLEKYNYPKHLAIRSLSDREDNIVFKAIKEKIASDIKRDYLEFQKKKEKMFKIGDSLKKRLGYYSCPAF